MTIPYRPAHEDMDSAPGRPREHYHRHSRERRVPEDVLVCKVDLEPLARHFPRLLICFPYIRLANCLANQRNAESNICRAKFHEPGYFFHQVPVR